MNSRALQRRGVLREGTYSLPFLFAVKSVRIISPAAVFRETNIMSSTRTRLLLSSIVTITLCHIVSVAQVQTGPNPTTVEIHGQVRFSEGGKPAANVVVRLESYDGGGSITEAFTDRLGKFRFTSIPPAMYSVRGDAIAARNCSRPCGKSSKPARA